MDQTITTGCGPVPFGTPQLGLLLRRGTVRDRLVGGRLRQREQVLRVITFCPEASSFIASRIVTPIPARAANAIT